MRVGLAMALLVVLCLVASPERVLATARSADWRWVTAALLLMPVFVFLRMAKWYLLLRQSMDCIPLRPFVRGYFLGMAAGLVTPARFGEMVRIWSLRAQTKDQTTVHVGYFMAEKVVEVACLVALAWVALACSGISPTSAVALPLLILLAIVVHQTRRTWSKVFYYLPILRRWPEAQVRNVVWAAVHLKIAGCAALSIGCFVVYLLQVAMVMASLGQTVGVEIAALLPMVMFANLVPITPGGFGMREGAAVVLLRSQGVPESVSFGAFFLTSVFDTVLPALVGALFLLPAGDSPRNHRSDWPRGRNG